MFAVYAMWFLPDLVLAKHAASTRHYKFDVRTSSYSHYVKHLAAFPLPTGITVFFLLVLFRLSCRK